MMILSVSECSSIFTRVPLAAIELYHSATITSVLRTFESSVQRKPACALLHKRVISQMPEFKIICCIESLRECSVALDIMAMTYRVALSFARTDIPTAPCSSRRPTFVPQPNRPICKMSVGLTLSQSDSNAGSTSA